MAVIFRVIIPVAHENLTAKLQKEDGSHVLQIVLRCSQQ